MNVTFKKIDDLNAIISIEVKNEDYQDNLNKQFKDYRKKAKIPGFRPGTVPLGMVKQMIGKSVLFEEVNRLTSEELYKYLQDNKIDILGQPMTSSTMESETDFDNYGDFTFHFDLGLAPIFDLKISTKDKLTRYEIELDGKEVETEIKNLRRQNGKLENIDKSETENDSIVLLMTEINSKGEHKDGGVFEQEVTVLPEVVKSKKVKKQLLNISVGDEIKLNVFDLFNEIYAFAGITLIKLNSFAISMSSELPYVKNVNLTPYFLFNSLYKAISLLSKPVSFQFFREIPYVKIRIMFIELILTNK